MGFKSELVELLRRRFDTCGIVTAIQISRNGQAGFCGGRSDKIEDFLITVEWFASPVFGDFGEESVLNWIPLGSASGIVSDGDVEGEAVGELSL